MVKSKINKLVLTLVCYISNLKSAWQFTYEKDIKSIGCSQ